MTELTPLLNDLLSKHDARTRHNASQPHDEFLKEAYKINAHITSLTAYLRSIRPSYLSTAPAPSRPNPSRLHLTNSQRDAIDANAKNLLKDLGASITQLDSTEHLRRKMVEEREKKKRGRLGGALMKWAEGDMLDKKGKVEVDGAEETVRIWREAVVMYLRQGLKGAGEVQTGMMARRVEREVERCKSVLWMSKGDGNELGRERVLDEILGGGEGGKSGLSVVEMEQERRGQGVEGLSEEQVQMLEEENGEMMRLYEGDLERIRTAQKSLHEIGDMQSQIIGNLQIQNESISHMEMESLNTTENIGGGNKQLKKATERKSTARMVFWATCGLCGFLITWDLVF